MAGDRDSISIKTIDHEQWVALGRLEPPRRTASRQTRREAERRGDLKNIKRRSIDGSAWHFVHNENLAKKIGRSHNVFNYLRTSLSTSLHLFGKLAKVSRGVLLARAVISKHIARLRSRSSFFDHFYYLILGVQVDKSLAFFLCIEEERRGRMVVLCAASAHHLRPMAGERSFTFDFLDR